MTVHADGEGESWDENSPDADRSVGLTYRSLQDLRRGVRIRGEKQHKTYGGSSCGGLHLPSKASVLLVDTTPNFAAYITGGTDPSCAEWGIAYDTSGYLWHVADNTLSFCALGLHPQSLCIDASARMTGTWQWDASQIFNDPVDMSDVAMEGSCEISSALMIDGTADFAKVVGFVKSVACYSFVEIDGTAANTGLLVDNSVCISGKFHCGTCILADHSEVDFSGKSLLNFRLPAAWFSCATTDGAPSEGYNVGRVDYSEDPVGDVSTYCVSFVKNMPTAQYAVILTPKCTSTATAQTPRILTCVSQIVSGFKFVSHTDDGLRLDSTGYFGVVWCGAWTG